MTLKHRQVKGLGIKPGGLFLTIALLTAVAPADAGPVGVSFFSAACLGGTYRADNCITVLDVSTNGTGTFSAGPVSTFFNQPGTNFPVLETTATGAAFAQPGGSLGAYAAMTGGFTSSFAVEAMVVTASGYYETVTLSNALLNGQPGMLNLLWTVDGTNTVDGDVVDLRTAITMRSFDAAGGSTAAERVAGLSTDLTLPDVTGLNAIASGSFAHAIGTEVSFVWGQPFDLGIELYAIVYAYCHKTVSEIEFYGCPFTANPLDVDIPFDIILNALNTASIETVIATRADGEIVTDYTVRSGSGALYGGTAENGGSVPEPATLILLLAGLVLLSLGQRRHFHRHS